MVLVISEAPIYIEIYIIQYGPIQAAITTYRNNVEDIGRPMLIASDCWLDLFHGFGYRFLCGSKIRTSVCLS